MQVVFRHYVNPLEYLNGKNGAYKLVESVLAESPLIDFVHPY